MSLRIYLPLLAAALATTIWLALDPLAPEVSAPRDRSAPSAEAAPPSAPHPQRSPIVTEPFVPPAAAEPRAPRPAVLELCFRDTLDEPVSDVEAAVLPGEPEEFAPRMPRRADELGRIRWELPAGRWRWTKLSSHHLEIEPGPELFRALTLPGGKGAWKVAASSQTSRPTSAAIELTSGETTTLRIRVHRGSRVRGTLITATVNPLWTRLSLYLLQHLDHPQGPEHALHLREQIAETHAGPAGTFAFDDLPPGRYQLTAAWRCADEICCARRAFALQGMEDEDLGAIAPDAGSSVLLELGIEDEHGPLELESLFGPLPEPITATLVIGRWMPNTADEAFSLVFEAELGRSLSFSGLPPGEWDVHSVIDPAWPSHRGALHRPQESGRFSIPGTGSLRYAWTYRGAPGAAALELEIVHAGEDPPACSWTLMPEGSGTTLRGTTSPTAWENDRQSIALVLEPGRYHAVIHTRSVRSTGRPRVDPGLQAYRAIEVLPGRQSATLLLEPGSSFRGEARRPDGALLGDRTLAFRPLGLPHRGCWLYTVRTDAQGRFRLAGLIPDHPLEGLGVTGTIDPDHSIQPATLVVDLP